MIRITLIVVCSLTIVGVLVYMHVQRPVVPVFPLLPEEQAAFAEAKMAWGDAVDAFGPEVVYEEVAEAYATRRGDEWHTAGHILGELFYERYGMQAVGMCDQRFDLGCYHEVIGRIVVSEGMGRSAALLRTCEEYGAREDCVHALGHGVLAASGYDEESLLRALDACSTYTKSAHLVHSCPAGAFMEYNTRLLADGTNRSWESTIRPLAPCDRLPEGPVRGICYFWMPQWWLGYLRGELSQQDLFSSFYELCASAQTKKDRSACFAGIGYTTMPTQAVHDGSPCSVLPEDARDACLAVAETGQTMNPYTHP